MAALPLRQYLRRLASRIPTRRQFTAPCLLATLIPWARLPIIYKRLRGRGRRESSALVRAGPLEFRFEATYSEYTASIALVNAEKRTTNQPIDSGIGSVWAGTANVAYRIPLFYGVPSLRYRRFWVYITRESKSTRLCRFLAVDMATDRTLDMADTATAKPK